MHRFVSPQRRLHYLLGHGLARTALSSCLPEVAPAEWDLRETPAGQPVIVAPRSGGGFNFSLAHTETMVACLVTRETQVGVDVEVVAPGADLAALASMILTEVERDRLNALPEAHRREELFRYWTLKEAFGKALGVGLSEPIRRHTFHLGGPAVVVQPPGQREIASDWSFAQWQASTGEIIAIALHTQTAHPVRLIQHLAPPSPRELDPRP